MNQIHEMTLFDQYEFKEILKKYSLKATPQRLAVNRAMMALGHACADQVSEWIEDNDHTHTTVASVYNILSQLALLGIYEHRMSTNNKMYFDVNTYKHIHLYDSVNHEYKDIIDEDIINSVETRLKGRKYRGYKIDCIDISIICHPSSRKVEKKNTVQNGRIK